MSFMQAHGHRSGKLHNKLFHTHANVGPSGFTDFPALLLGAAGGFLIAAAADGGRAVLAPEDSSSGHDMSGSCSAAAGQLVANCWYRASITLSCASRMSTLPCVSVRLSALQIATARVHTHVGPTSQTRPSS